MTTVHRRTATGWLAAFSIIATPTVIGAQVASTYVVKQAGREIGREHLTATGSALRLDSNYPAANTHIDAQLERAADGAVATFRLRASGADAGTIAAAGNGTRLVVRTERNGAETARELPGGRAVVLLDEHAYTLYQQLADLATPTGLSITGMMPRSGKRLRISARRDGPTVTLTGDLTGTITLDANSQLERIELPDQRLTITRVPA